MRWMIGMILLGCVMGLVGCGCGGGPRTDKAPVIARLTLNPTELRFPGGEVTVSADVTDNGTLTRVWAVATKPDQSTEEVLLNRAAGQTYRGTWTAGANTRTDGQAQTYSFRVHAQDNVGQETTSDPLTLTVQATESPPEAPPF